MIVDRTYDRLIDTARAEKILSNSTIHVDMDKLRAYVLTHRRDKEAWRFLRLSAEGNGYLTCQWYGRDKRTYRIYPKKGEPQLTTLSNVGILSSFTSRHQSGKIVCIDYNQFEYSIIRCLLDLKDAPIDIHSWAADVLSMPRDVCKILNNAILYGSNDDVQRRAKDLYERVERKGVEKYLRMIIQIRSKIDTFILDKKDSFIRNGYIINGYGRRIYPKNNSSIFNNLIQCVGSEIMIDTIINLNSVNSNSWNIMFQRFDAIYFDFSEKALKDELDEVKKIIVGSNKDIDLSATISIGDSVATLKEHTK